MPTLQHYWAAGSLFGGGGRYIILAHRLSECVWILKMAWYAIKQRYQTKKILKTLKITKSRCKFKKKFIPPLVGLIIFFSSTDTCPICGIYNTLSVSSAEGQPPHPPKQIGFAYSSKRHLMVRLHFWSSDECGVHLNRPFFLVHSDSEWWLLFGSHPNVI